MAIRPTCLINKMRAKRRSSRRNAGGFTLVEMMIGSALFIVVMMGMYKLLEASRDSRFTTEERSEMLRTARTALDTMGHDIVNAGVAYPNSGAVVPNGLLQGILGQTYIDTDTIHDFMTPIIAGDGVNAVGSASTDQLSLIFIDNTFNGGDALSISSASPASNWMVINTTAPGSPTNSVCTPGDIYLISGSSSSALGWLTHTASTDKLMFEGTDPLNINQPSQSNGVLSSVTYPAAATKVFWIRYWVSSTGTLFRRVYGDPSIQIGNGASTSSTGYLDTPIADNVTDFQIKYTLVDNTVVNSPTFAQYPSIRQVTATITLQSPDIDHRLGRRETLSMSSTFDAHNLAYKER